MGRKHCTILAAGSGLLLAIFVLLIFGSRAVSTKAAAPQGRQFSQMQSPQAAAANGIFSRPLVVALGTEPATLDINVASDTTSHAVLDQLMEGLYRYRVDGSVEPAGAVSYTVSSDGRVYTVTLRSDALWSDGEPVTAQHYVDGIIRLLDPDTGASYAYIMYVLEGAEDFNTGVITDPAQVGVTAVDTYTLRFTLREPAAHFPSILAMCTTYPVRLDIINSDPEWTEAGHFVGNGPYVLTEWGHWNRLVIDKNPLYHDASQVTIERVIFPIIPDVFDQLAAYENDGLDVSGYPSSELQRILSDPVLGAEFHRLPRPGVYYLGLNTQLTPTNNISVCKALASAIDRSYLITEVMRTPWREGATSVIPPGIPGYQNGAVGYTFNVTQAQAYLAAAGYPGGAGFPGVELWANYGNEDLINAVADQWRNNLNITVTTVYIDWGTYVNILDDCHDNPGPCTYNAYRMGWLMDYADAYNILNDVFHPDSPFQHTGWDNARYRELMALAMTETNQISRTAYFQEADRILVEDTATVIPLFFYDRTGLVKSDIIFEYPPFGAPHYMYWRIVTIVTATIPSAGGTVMSPDRDTTVEFPEGAVMDTVLVTYTSFFLPPYPPAGTFAFAGTGFVLEVTDLSSGEEITTFVEPLTVTINYTEGDVEMMDEGGLELLYWNGSAWVDDGVTIVERDTTNNQLVARIEHLTEFALFGHQYRAYLPLILRSYR